jgi:hypothetical protein
MHDLLNHYPVHFPKRNDQLYTLKQFIETSTKSQLPIIVNIASSNNYGRGLKHFLTKNTHLLLIGVYQFDSVLAEYHRSQDGRRHSHRHRLILTQGKMATKASTKFRTMKMFSKSLASLTTLSQSNNYNYDDDEDDDDNDDDDQSYHQRSLLKSLNERRSSSIPLCRIPIQYSRLFELLNENDQSVEPYHKLTDLILPGYPEKRIEKWPRAFFLRSSCPAYTQKNTPEYVHSTSINDQKSNSTASNDSCYSSSSDIDSQKNSIILKDEIQTLQAGQILTILGDCIARHMQLVDKEQQQQQQPPPSPVTTPLSPFTIASNWLRDKTKIFFPKKRRSSPSPDIISSEISSNKLISHKYEPYLKCQTEQDDIVYIPLHESGVFSPVYCPTSHTKSNTDLSRLDISEVYHLKNLISNFRFPISVRHLDGSVNIENIYSPATINRQETATKLRLLMRYNEEVVFACPINTMSSKSSKTSLPCLVLPLSTNVDMEIQPCINMSEISKGEEFHKLLDSCFQIIEQYQNEISLIHFPLQITNTTDRRKQALYKKRSQSESFLGFPDDGQKYRFRYSNERLHYSNDNNPDISVLSISSPFHHRNSIETIQQRLSNDTERTSMRHSGYHSKRKIDKRGKYSREGYSSEDEIYQDVDKIYDYIRSGDITDDVRKIQAKEKMYHSTQTINLLPPTINVCLF